MENPNQNQVREIFTTEIGKFYFLDRIVIGEIDHGATLTYQKSLEVIEKQKKCMEKIPTLLTFQTGLILTL